MDGKDRATGTIKNTSYEMSGLFGCRVGLSQEGTKRRDWACWLGAKAIIAHSAMPCGLGFML